MDYDKWWERPWALLVGVVGLSVAVWTCWDVARGDDSSFLLLRALYVAINAAGFIAFAVSRVRRSGSRPEPPTQP